MNTIYILKQRLLELAANEKRLQAELVENEKELQLVRIALDAVRTCSHPDSHCEADNQDENQNDS